MRSACTGPLQDGFEAYWILPFWTNFLLDPALQERCCLLYWDIVDRVHSILSCCELDNVNLVSRMGV